MITVLNPCHLDAYDSKLDRLKFDPFDSGKGFKGELTAVLRQGARQMLQAAIESEAADYIAEHAGYLDDNGCRMAVLKGVSPRASDPDGHRSHRHQKAQGQR